MIKNLFNGFKENLVFFGEMTKDFMLKKIDNRYINFSRSLEVHGVDKVKKCVFLEEDNKSPVWCIEIALQGNESFSIANFETLVKNYGYNENSKLILFYSKRKIIDEEAKDFYTKQSIYLFSFNKKLLEDIAFEFDITLMDVDKIFQALYDIGLINQYHISTKSLALKSTYHTTTLPKDELNNLYFKMIFAEGVYKALVKNENPQERNYELYQGISIDGDYLHKKPDLYRLFREEWHGYIAMTIDLYSNAVQKAIEGVNDYVQFGEKNEDVRKIYAETSKSADKLAELTAIYNIVALVDNPDVMSRISTILETQFIPKSVGVKNIVYGTPLLERSKGYDFIAPLSSAKSWIKSIHKKHNIKSRTAKHLIGRDVSYNFINYSWSETGDSLHWSIVAPTRSGKTVTILKTIQTILEAKIVEKTYTEKKKNIEMQKDGELMVEQKIVSADNLGKTKIVHFDTGNSGLSFVTELQRKYPSRVFISQENINYMRFGLLNMEYNSETESINDNDFLFTVSIMNLILKLTSTTVDAQINGSELSELRKAVVRIFSKDDYRGLTLKELKGIGGYKDTIMDIYRFAEENNIEITSRTRTTEIGLRGTRLDYIQKPTLATLIKELSRKIDNYTVSQDEEEACSTLMTKLKSIAEQPMFAYYDKSNIRNSDYFYIELGQLKELGEQFFLPAYMITLRRLYRRDVANAKILKDAGKNIPAIVYVMEEVHNFIHIEVLEDYFEKVTREASKYQIYFGFITQTPKDIPRAILSNIGSRMVLSSNKVTKSDLAYYWATDAENKEEIQQYVDFYATSKRKYMSFINSGNGIVTMQQRVTKEEEKIFNSNGEADIAEDIDEIV